MKPFSPRYQTEWYGKSPFLNCTWASGLMLANKASRGKYPHTNAEVDALRRDSGDHLGGSSLRDLQRGIDARYGWTLPINGVSWTGLLTRLARTDGAIVQGLYSKLPAHYTRFDPHFASTGNKSAHAAYVQGHDRGGNYHLGANGLPTDVFWCDPLGHDAAGTPIDGRYRGEWMPVGTLHRFVLGLAPDSDLLAATVAQGSQS